MKDGEIMSSMIVIDPNDEIRLWDYSDFNSIHEAVDGCFETCSVFGALDVMCVAFCNDEFLLRDDLKFNALGMLISNQPIYGNIVILENGYSPHGERDSYPFDLLKATSISMVLEELKKQFMPILKGYHSQFDNYRPDPQTGVFVLSDEEDDER